MSSKVKICNVKQSNRESLSGAKVFPPCEREKCIFFDEESETCAFFDLTTNGVIMRLGKEIQALKKEIRTRKAVREAANV